jgi:hypothetical protein
MGGCPLSFYSLRATPRLPATRYGLVSHPDVGWSPTLGLVSHPVVGWSPDQSTAPTVDLPLCNWPDRETFGRVDGPVRRPGHNGFCYRGRQHVLLQTSSVFVAGLISELGGRYLHRDVRAPLRSTSESRSTTSAHLLGPRPCGPRPCMRRRSSSSSSSSSSVSSSSSSSSSASSSSSS